eukprot:s3850_g5.t1
MQGEESAIWQPRSHRGRFQLDVGMVHDAIIAFILSVGMGLLTFTGSGIERISEDFQFYFLERRSPRATFGEIDSLTSNTPVLKQDPCFFCGEKSMAPLMEEEGGWLPPFGLKISLTFADELLDCKFFSQGRWKRLEVQEALNTQFKLFTGEHDIQSFLLQKVMEMLEKSMEWSGGSKDAKQLYQKLRGLQTLSRTGVADIQPAPKACLFLGTENPVGRTSSDPESRQRARQDAMCSPPSRSAKSAEALAIHEQRSLDADISVFGDATKEQRSQQDVRQNRSQDVQVSKPNRTGSKDKKQTMPTIDEQPDEPPSTTDDSDGGAESEGSSNDSGAMDFAEVPDDLPAVAPPVAGVVKSTPTQRQGLR